MSNNPTINAEKLAKKAYDAYRTASGGVSYYTKQPLPEYDTQPDAVKKCWEAAVLAVQPSAPEPETATAEIAVVGNAATAPAVELPPGVTAGAAEGSADETGNVTAGVAQVSNGADQAAPQTLVETGQASAAKAA